MEPQPFEKPRDLEHLEQQVLDRIPFEWTEYRQLREMLGDVPWTDGHPFQLLDGMRTRHPVEMRTEPVIKDGVRAGIRFFFRRVGDTPAGAGKDGMSWHSEMVRKYRLDALQNHRANVGHDHLTICGCFTTEAQFAAHAEKLRERIAAFEAERAA